MFLLSTDLMGDSSYVFEEGLQWSSFLLETSLFIILCEGETDSNSLAIF